MDKNQNHDEIQSVSVVGAGVMGRSIAEVSAEAGLSVRIFDEDKASAESAVEAIQTAVADSANLSIAVTDADIANADLVVEAIPENVALKTDLFTRLEPHLASHTIVATNTSSISVSELASSWKNADRFCGLHFCHPIRERRLVEVVGADTTSNPTLERAVQFATRIGGLPIRVKDTPAFLLNRLLVPYMNEALELLLDGADVADLDGAAAEFGMPVGPLALFDELGIDVAIAVGRSLYRAYSDRIVPSELLIAMYKSGRLGRKSGRGFYAIHDKTSTPQLDDDVVTLIRERRRTYDRLPETIVSQRLLLPMLLEATRAIEDKLVDEPALIDKALKHGLGMTDRYQGLLQWGNSIGASNLIKWLEPLQPLGKRFEPTSLLNTAAKNNTPITTTRHRTDA